METICLQAEVPMTLSTARRVMTSSKAVLATTSMTGGHGEDTLNGGDGNDTLSGGSGSRRHLNGGGGNNVITDAGSGADVIYRCCCRFQDGCKCDWYSASSTESQLQQVLAQFLVLSRLILPLYRLLLNFLSTL